MGALAELSRIEQAPRRLDGEWDVGEDGLEHRATGYFIARNLVASRRSDGHWEWPLHMAEKRWCAMRPFRKAFLAALTAYGVEADARLSVSFAVAQGARDTRAGLADERVVRLGEAARGLRALKGPDRRPPERVRSHSAGEPSRPAVAMPAFAEA